MHSIGDQITFGHTQGRHITAPPPCYLSAPNLLHFYRMPLSIVAFLFAFESHLFPFCAPHEDQPSFWKIESHVGVSSACGKHKSSRGHRLHIYCKLPPMERRQEAEKEMRVLFWEPLMLGGRRISNVFNPLYPTNKQRQELINDPLLWGKSF